MIKGRHMHGREIKDDMSGPENAGLENAGPENAGPENEGPWVKGKGKVFPYSLPSVGPGADPGVQAVSPQVT